MQVIEHMHFLADTIWFHDKNPHKNIIEFNFNSEGFEQWL